MGVRPGRLLPSVIVGGLLATGLALGAGAASAAETCTIGGVEYDMSKAASTVTKDSGGSCKNKVPVVGDLVDGLTGTLEAITSSGAGALGLAPYIAPTTTTTAATTTKPASSSTINNGGGGVGGVGGSGGGAQGRSNVVVARPPAPGPAAPVLAPAPAANLLAPGAGAGGLGLGALKGAPLAPGLFGVGAYNPGLLLGAPAGSPLANLAGTDPASAVTTTSQVQAMAFDGLPGGVGTPATIGVLILAGLAGFAVRHRVLTRMRRRDAALATTEAPAA